MPAEIILQARKENEVVIEGEVHLVINEDTPSDIVIEVPNQNGRLLSKEMLSNNTLVSSDTIKRPVILVPENNSIGFTGTFVLSPYEPSETYSGVPTGMRIEISATEDFSMIMKNVVIDELLSEVPVTFEESSEVLYARVKYVSDSHVSGYSDVVKFTNSDFYVYQPKILTPTVNATGVARTPFIQVSDYQYMGNENYYAGLTYEVATDSNFTNIVETDTVGSPNTGGSGSSNGVYLNNFIVNTILNDDTIYYVRVKYLGTLYPSSIWSDVISFRTFDVEEKIVLFNDSRLVSSTRVTPIIDNSYYFMLARDNSATGNALVLVKYNLNNEVMLAKKVNIPNINRINWGDVHYYNNNLYVAVDLYMDTGTLYQSAIVKMDLNLNIIKCVQLRATDSNAKNVLSGGNRLTFIDNEIYQQGQYYDGTRVTSAAFFTKYDLNLNKLSHHCMASGVWSYINQIIDLGTNLLVVITTYTTNTTFRKLSLLIINKATYSKVKEVSILNPTNTHVYYFNIIKNGNNLLLLTRLTNNISTIWKYITLDYSLNIIKDEKLNTTKNFNIVNIKIANNILTGVGNKFPSPNIDAYAGYTTTSNCQIVISGNINDNVLKMLEIDNYTNLLVDYNIDNNKYLLQGHKTSAIIDINSEFNNVISNGYTLNTSLINIVTDNTTILTTENLYSPVSVSPVIINVTGVTLTDVDYFNNKTEIII